MQEYNGKITALGAQSLGISIAADYQAQHLMDNEIDFDLLLDPDGEFKKTTLSVPRLQLRDLFSSVARKRYTKWLGKTRQGRPTAGPSEPPAVAIIDSDGIIRYLYRGETLGDYPTIEVVIGELEKLAA